MRLLHFVFFQHNVNQQKNSQYEHLKIGVKVAHIGNSSVDLHYVGKKQNGAIAFTGRGTMVQMSKTTGKGVPWDESARARLIENM